MTNQRYQTIRQEIIGYLEKNRLSVREISQLAGIMEKDVFHHLPFIEKTVRQLKKKVHVKPYHCLDCGFQFKERKTYKKPGKCPKCRDGRIGAALFWIE